MVAAAGETVGLKPRVALICAAALLVALGVVVFLGIHYTGMDRMHLEQTPEVLAQKAREITARLGYPDRPLDHAYGLDYDGDFQDSVEKNDKPHPNWDTVLPGRPSLLQFWYRQSPDYMAAEGYRDQLLNPGIVTETDPPTTLSGMINLRLEAATHEGARTISGKEDHPDPRDHPADFVPRGRSVYGPTQLPPRTR
jgi:hypothetical protein